MLYISNKLSSSLFTMGIVSMLIFPSCREEEEVAVGDPSMLTFESSYAVSKESDGLLKVFLKLDQPQNTQTVVHFKVAGNAIKAYPGIKNADYELITESPLTIKKGETQAAIEIKLLEDQAFEQQLENIVLSIDGILEGNAVISDDLQQLIHVHDIEENDYQLYLEWESAQEADLNMFIEAPNKSLFSGNNLSGFEEITITNVKDQAQYFLDIWHQSGESPVSYQLKGLYAGEKEKKILTSGVFDSGHTNKKPGTSDGNEVQNFLLIKEGKSLKVLK